MFVYSICLRILNRGWLTFESKLITSLFKNKMLPLTYIMLLASSEGHNHDVFNKRTHADELSIITLNITLSLRTAFTSLVVNHAISNYEVMGSIIVRHRKYNNMLSFASIV